MRRGLFSWALVRRDELWRGMARQVVVGRDKVGSGWAGMVG